MGGDNYAGVKKTGAFKFKGDKSSLKKQRRKERKSADKLTKENKEEPEEEEEDVPVVVGSGRIVATGTTVHGLETKFKEEIAVGDSLLVQHPNTHQMEFQMVTGILTQRSLQILQTFSTDFSSTTAYHIQRDSIVMERKAKKERKKEGDITEEEFMRKQMEKQLEKKMKEQQKVVKVQEKVRGGGGISYRTVEKKMDKPMGAGDALDERCKLGRDKYCW